jgi:hypothetical protein
MDEAKFQQQTKILKRFVGVFCRETHGSPRGELCDECRDLLDYATDRLATCPMDPKPKCKDCPVHCYAPEYRKRIAEVMRLAGTYYVKRGRLDWLWKYFRSR